MDKKRIDVILEPPQEPEYVLLATPDISREFGKILSSSFIDNEIDFFFIYANFEEEYTTFLRKIKDSHTTKISNCANDIYQSTDLLSATKEVIWILFYSFLQIPDKTEAIISTYNKIYDDLALNFYTFRNILIDDTSISGKKFVSNWCVLCLCIFFSIISKEFTECSFKNNGQFFLRSESIVMSLLIGFTAEMEAIHEKIKSFFEDKSFFEKQTKGMDIFQKELLFAVNRKSFNDARLINRHRILFNSSDVSPLLSRALELKGCIKDLNIRKKKTKNRGQTIPYQNVKDPQDIGIKAEASKYRISTVKREHTKAMNMMMRTICAEEARLESSIENDREECEALIANKGDMKIRVAKIVENHFKNKKKY